MAKDLAVVIIHGMGSQQPNFMQDLIDELADRVPGSDRIAWQSIYWADILSTRQETYLTDAKKANELDYISLRRFVISALGDAAAYRRVGNDPTTTYELIHERVRDAIKTVYEDSKKGLNKAVKPLVILAHSLGGHIISNYLWDIQEGTAIVNPGTNPFERGETLRAFITFGCNIPLFTFALKEIIPITLPTGATWVNYYDPDDVLGYPLKPLSPLYRKTVNADIAINVGSVFSNWNPASHGDYWTDNDFTIPVAQFLKKTLET